MTSIPDVFYLSFGNIHIKVEFGKTEKHGLKKIYKQNIYNFYKPFIVVNKPLRIQCSIIFQDPQNMAQVSLKKMDYIAYLHEKNKKEYITYFHISLPQFQLIIDKILTGLNQINCFRLHASSVIINNKVLVFLAPSGGGKSTIVKLLSTEFKPFSDDSLFLLREKSGYYGIKNLTLEKNPYNSTITKYPVKAIFFLKKDKKFEVLSLSNKSEIVERLSPQVWIKSKKTVNQFMDSYFDFFKKNKFYILSFAKNRRGLINFFENNRQFFY